MVAADSKAKFLQDAEKYMLQGKVQQAIGEYLKIVRDDPKDVLIVNTVGDLYLRQGDTLEANKCFAQVAEEYVRNNFFLKAIAVYKKILNGDPGNLEISSTVASLYAKQGLSIDARNLYLRVAALLEREGKSKELLQAYEKIVELDPSDPDIQRKAAELHLAQGDKEKALLYWTRTAQAQENAGDFNGALDSFGRAVQLDPVNPEALKGFFDCSLKTGNSAPVIERLKHSLEIAPENIDMREMLGRAYLANGDPEQATKVFQVVLSMDESRYEYFFAVCQCLIDKEEYEDAAACLDPIIPILIGRRQTDRAVKLYDSILQRSPLHLPSMMKAASIYSATDDQPRFLETLDKIVNCYVEQKSLDEALETLGKILQANPESEKHRTLHRRLFEQAHPGVPYVSPVHSREPEPHAAPGAGLRMSPDAGASNRPDVVEVDLLLNYGLADKALSILKNMETRDPADKDVRIRLISTLKDQKKYTEAAEQCMVLAALYLRENDEDSARKSIEQARQLDPELVGQDPDPESFARRLETAAVLPGEAVESAMPADENEIDLSVDLSEDLAEILSTGNQEEEAVDLSSEPQAAPSIAEEFPQDIRAGIGSKPVQEQYQEVDFYIRLGFADEALAKLDEMAKTHPDDPELISRYEQLRGQDSSEFRVRSSELETPSSELKPQSSELRSLSSEPTAPNSEIPTPSSEFSTPNSELRTPNSTPNSELRTPNSSPINSMFADVLEESGLSTEPSSDQDSFENHFSLGTAYREMDLIEEAIKEFEAAMKSLDPGKDPKQLIQCCGMLSTCFLKKGMPRSALRWCQTGLGISDISSHESMALRYDMGVAHSMAGSNERALECFDQIFGTDPGYRDVAQKIDELKGGFERHAP